MDFIRVDRVSLKAKILFLICSALFFCGCEKKQSSVIKEFRIFKENKVANRKNLSPIINKYAPRGAMWIDVERFLKSNGFTCYERAEKRFDDSIYDCLATLNNEYLVIILHKLNIVVSVKNGKIVSASGVISDIGL